MNQRPVAIVTGVGRGIGAATAKLLAARGYAVCVNFLHDLQAAQEVARSIIDADGQAIAVQSDISSEADVLTLFREVDSQLGCVAALVNNAATLERQMRLDSMDAARINRIFAVN